MTEYASKEYWNDRYKRDKEPFDWLQKYKTLKGHFSQLIRKGEKILVVGCGNSKLSQKLYDDGYTTIANLDFSDVVIRQLKKKYKDRPGMTYVVHDISTTHNPQKTHILQDRSYDVIIDKATGDSILCSKDGEKKLHRMVSEVYRALKKNGRFIMLSCENEISKKPYLLNDWYHWKLSVRKIPKPTFVDLPEEEKHHFLYILKKTTSH